MTRDEKFAARERFLRVQIGDLAHSYSMMFNAAVAPLRAELMELEKLRDKGANPPVYLSTLMKQDDRK